MMGTFKKALQLLQQMKQQKCHSVQEKLLKFARCQYYFFGMSYQGFPFEIIASKPCTTLDNVEDCPSKQKRINFVEQPQNCGKEIQQTLENSEQFRKKVEELKKYYRAIILFVQGKKSSHEKGNNQNSKGYLIVATLDQSLGNFLYLVRNYFKIKQTETISMFLKSKSPTGMKMISHQTEIKSIPLNEMGFIEIETVKLETLG